MQFLKLFFFVLASLPHNVFSQINTAIMPVTKDAKTSLFKVGMTLWQYSSAESSYLLDLDAPFTWEDCVMGRLGPTCEDMYACYLPISCSHSSALMPARILIPSALLSTSQPNMVAAYVQSTRSILSLTYVKYHSSPLRYCCYLVPMVGLSVGLL